MPAIVESRRSHRRTSIGAKKLVTRIKNTDYNYYFFSCAFFCFGISRLLFYGAPFFYYCIFPLVFRAFSHVI